MRKKETRRRRIDEEEKKEKETITMRVAYLMKKKRNLSLSNAGEIFVRCSSEHHWGLPIRYYYLGQNLGLSNLQINLLPPPLYPHGYHHTFDHHLHGLFAVDAVLPRHCCHHCHYHNQCHFLHIAYDHSL